MVRIRGGAVDAELLAEILHEFRAAAEGAGERAADADMVFTRSVLAKAGVESHHLEHLDRLKREFRGHPVDRLRRDETELVLHDMEQRQHGGALALGVMGDAPVRLGLEIRGDGEGREMFASGGFLRGYEIGGRSG